MKTLKVIFNRAYRLKYTKSRDAIVLYNDLLDKWRLIAGNTAKNSIFEARILMDMNRAYKAQEKTTEAEECLDRAKSIIIGVSCSEEHPAILDYFFAKIEFLVA